MIIIKVNYNVGSNPSKGSDIQHEVTKMSRRYGLSPDPGNWRYLLSNCTVSGDNSDDDLRRINNLVKKLKALDKVEKVTLTIQ